MGLVPVQARSPRALLIEHGDGLRTAVLVLDGVVSGTSSRLRTQDGRTLSAQIYRAPISTSRSFRRSPRLWRLFRSGQPPWPVQRGGLISGLLAAAAGASGADTGWIETPHLNRGYHLNP